jgi:hypothetical protein
MKRYKIMFSVLSKAIIQQALNEFSDQEDREIFLLKMYEFLETTGIDRDLVDIFKEQFSNTLKKIMLEKELEKEQVMDIIKKQLNWN